MIMDADLSYRAQIALTSLLGPRLRGTSSYMAQIALQFLLLGIVRSYQPSFTGSKLCATIRK